MQDFDYTLRWYHGSQQKLTTLRVGSSITQNRNVAKAFSHRPSLLTQSGGGTVKHDGVTPGYLYTVTDEIGPNDVRSTSPLSKCYSLGVADQSRIEDRINRTDCCDGRRASDRSRNCRDEMETGGKGREVFRGGICLT